MENLRTTQINSERLPVFKIIFPSKITVIIFQDESTIMEKNDFRLYLKECYLNNNGDGVLGTCWKWKKNLDFDHKEKNIVRTI